ncbi:MAG: NADH-quinone oxidoreductase subunit M [Runella slithyformis]|nr:MAG: NADH-quinone oxidoreductase subunit M [Runella slithyformis]TAE94564.1 MAG: NADH-quinone oxidoreductase subunit M [Runella slithyformis]TAF28936.1 MAG: NADH-quinone oxidoreductase subunit M [Runella slithyformis]TAF47988.1 MAG: NADH-quinone oxidoreductase subunit M [Runella slithyformis]TAF82474.1 MAG: NADH-quinone oxidoreductase subunit M [Runella slithyformis]
MLTLLLILIPVLSALAVLITKNNSAKQVAMVGTLFELGLAVAVFISFEPNATQQFGFSYPWIASAGIMFAGGIDGISLLLVMLTAFLTPLIVLSTFRQPYKNASTFYALILFMQAALMGVFTAADAFLFYLFFEAALIPIYFLAAVWGGENRIKVTFKFFVYTIFGSLFMLVALVYLYFQTAGLSATVPHSSAITALYKVGLDAQKQGWIFWAFFVAFAIKMPIFPFHTWQPDTYTESPTPATMLLAGIMLKMGVYGVLRFLLPIAPLGMEAWSTTAIVLSVVGIVYGSIIAIQQRDIKRLVAYSSFAHVGLMAAGVFSQTLNGVQGALIQMIAHGINVVGLFFVIEIIFSRTKSRNIEQLGGITQRTPQLTVYFMILLLGSVALPLTNGFVGEFLLLSGVYEFNKWLGAVAGLTIILGAVYMLRLFQKAMFGGKSSLTEHFADLSLSERAVLLPLAIMVFWIGLYPNSFLKLTEPAVNNLLQMVHY